MPSYIRVPFAFGRVVFNRRCWRALGYCGARGSSMQVTLDLHVDLQQRCFLLRTASLGVCTASPDSIQHRNKHRFLQPFSDRVLRSRIFAWNLTPGMMGYRNRVGASVFALESAVLASESAGLCPYGQYTGWLAASCIAPK